MRESTQGRRSYHRKTYLPPLPSVAGAVVADTAAHVEEVAAFVESAAAKEQRLQA